MAREFGGDLYDFGNLSDDEIRQIVVDRLREYSNLDAEWIEVDVRDGFVTLSGRVGTDGEYQVAEKVIDDVLGIENFSNELVVDELHRGEAPVAADDANVEEMEADPQLGEGSSQQSDTADHLVQDVEAETFGTHDMGTAIRDGTAYIPPEGPMPDGYTSRENH